jgi:hypothetical protein
MPPAAHLPFCCLVQVSDGHPGGDLRQDLLWVLLLPGAQVAVGQGARQGGEQPPTGFPVCGKQSSNEYY